MYICPVCRSPLNPLEQRYACANGHSFDIARKGYVNLLLPQQMSSKQPGDNKLMIAARTAFLSAGYYQPLVHTIIALCQQHRLTSVLDAGCGEGYYTAALAAEGMTTGGLDISKEGIIAACRRSKNVHWCIASVVALPYAQGYFDGVLSVFSRPTEAEFARVLCPGGKVIFVGPGEGHLARLRERLYDNVREYPREKHESLFTEHFSLAEEQSLQYTFELPADQVENLLKMTPHYWHSSPHQQQRLREGGGFTETADFTLRVYRRCDRPEVI